MIFLFVPGLRIHRQVSHCALCLFISILCKVEGFGDLGFVFGFGFVVTKTAWKGHGFFHCVQGNGLFNGCTGRAVRLGSLDARLAGTVRTGDGRRPDCAELRARQRRQVLGLEEWPVVGLAGLDLAQQLKYFIEVLGTVFQFGGRQALQEGNPGCRNALPGFFQDPSHWNGVDHHLGGHFGAYEPVQGDAVAEDVRLRTGQAEQLLGGHEAQSPHGLAYFGERRSALADVFCDAKVGELGNPICAQQDVVGLDVPVNDVRGVDCSQRSSRTGGVIVDVCQG